MSLGFKLKKYLTFSKRELGELLATILILGFILSFKYWGGETADVSIGIYNLIVMSLVAFVCMIAHVGIQKIVAIRNQAIVEYRAWWLGLFIAIYITLMSYGEWYFILPGGLIYSSIRLHKIHTKSQELSFKEMSKIALSGPLINLFLALLFQSIILSGTTNLFLEKLVTLNLVLAICTILPIPQLEKLFTLKKSDVNLDGVIIFYWNRIKYLFWFLFFILVFFFFKNMSLAWAITVAILVAGSIAIFVWFTKEL